MARDSAWSGAASLPDLPTIRIGETEWYDFAEIFGFDPEGRETVAGLPSEAQRYIRDWQRGAVTLAEMRARVTAMG